MSNNASPFSHKKKPQEQAEASAAVKGASPSTEPAPVPSDNWLLAGYLAHEFLTKGTLFGKRWAAEPAELGSGSASGKARRVGLGSCDPPRPAHTDEAYHVITEGVRLRRVFNPSNLAQWQHNLDGKEPPRRGT
ncbi:hypothetical protein AXF42_Ash018165 [Apostasia shenzhenica]|uniref:Uncharacterized protein n=1 Tax=Apostasia shenzhenica TaxID=1088818 RepID=A0A2I0AF64_9ASPA|nr:hypothetical protein AXF42_Ash018165 [Apostasia shenzhenica]